MATPEDYMQRCFDLAKLAGKNVKSNPKVGAVLVYQDRIIGEGYHEAYGGPHAEINALNSVSPEEKEFIKDSTLYVSLEPCCIDRKTPPCTDGIIEHGIKEVIFSVQDPNPDVAGQSIEILKARGLTVSHGLLSNQGEQLIRPFKANLNKRPYVILKFAQSSDAYIGKRGKTVSISNNYSKILSHRWRSEVDGILVGYQTALIDDPQLNTRLWSGDDPLRIVLDPRAELPLHLKVCSDDAPTLFVNDVGTADSDSFNKDRIKISADESFIQNLLRILFDKGIYSLIVEGGTKTIQKFLETDLWDEARVITNNQPLRSGIKAPYIIGLPYTVSRIKDDEITYVYRRNDGSQSVQ